MKKQNFGITDKYILSLIDKHTKKHSHYFHSRGGGYDFTHFYKEDFAKELASIINSRG